MVQDYAEVPREAERGIFFPRALAAEPGATAMLAGTTALGCSRPSCRYR